MNQIYTRRNLQFFDVEFRLCSSPATNFKFIFT